MRFCIIILHFLYSFINDIFFNFMRIVDTLKIFGDTCMCLNHDSTHDFY